MNESDLELLHTYLDGELPMSQCEGLWQRLAAEKELAAELSHLRGEHAVRQNVFASLEPDDRATKSFTSSVMRAARRQEMLGHVSRALTIATSIAACVLFGFTVGWLGRDKYTGSNPGAQAAPIVSTMDGAHSGSGNLGGFVVNVRDQSGHVVAVKQFKTLEEARQFADDQINAQANRPMGGGGMVVPVDDRF